jgi:hypothetical protein
LHKIGRKVFSQIHQLVKGHPITIGQILADFVSSRNGKIVETPTQILHFSRKNFPDWQKK